MNNIGIYCRVKTANDAWQFWFDALKDQAAQGVKGDSRDGAVVGEFLNAVTVIEDPTRNIVTSKDRKLPMRYAVGELLWYLSGSNRLKDIEVFSKAWDRMSDDGETVNSAYGHRIFNKFGFNQLEYVINALKKDPNSRQAVIHIKDPQDYTENPTKDVPCTVCLQFFIRDNRLHMTTYMRSNDVWTGFPYDVFSFTSMQIMLAFAMGVEIGTYTHIAGSLHMYERSLKEWASKHDVPTSPVPLT